MSVCPCVCLFTFEVPFKCLFAPTSQSRMSKIFRDSESLGKSNGKKWSQIWTFVLLLILSYKICWKPRFPLDERPLVERFIANIGISLDVFEFLRFGWFFPFFKKIGFLGILGPPYRGIGATIRIGQEMLCLPYAGFFWGKMLLLIHYIYISTMVFNYTQMKMANLSPTSPNMSSIGEVWDRLGKTFLTSLVRNHWATGGLRVNSIPYYNHSFVPARGEYNIAKHT